MLERATQHDPRMARWPLDGAAIANLRRGLDLGYSAPRITVVDVPEQVRSLQSGESPFLGIASRADDPEFAAAVRATFDEEISPALEHFAAFIEDEYLARAREEIALSAQPGGAECYPALVRFYATIQPSADEIHRLGLEQIALIRADLQQTIDEHFGGGTIEAFLRRVNTDPAFTFDTEDAVLQYSVDALDG